MIKKILISFLLAIGIVCGIAATRSDDMNVSRSATMSAPADKIYAVVSDFQQWDAWPT